MKTAARRLVACAALASLGLAARANDTELTYGGTPRPLNGNTTVSMQREFVSMVVGDGEVTVDCRFTFHNTGPARKVRMGFPDEGGEPGEEIDSRTGKPIPGKPSITVFRSWVGGKPVQTSVIPANDMGSFWHVKRVDFPANATLEVRDRYVVPVGSSVAYWPRSVSLASYVLHTGASWHGPIGRSEVQVVFASRSVRPPLVARRLPDLRDPARHTAFARGMKADAHTVYYQGPCAPAVSGKTLRFVRTDWRPGTGDDIRLVFGVRGSGG